MKKYDVVARVGTFRDKNGEEKARWKNVGAVVTTENGHALLLDKTFNPAGLAEPDRESILLSLFEPKDNNQQPAPQQSGNSFDDDIPF